MIEASEAATQILDEADDASQASINKEDIDIASDTSTTESDTSAQGKNEAVVYCFADAPDMAAIPEEVVSTSVIVVDKETNEIIAARDAKSRISPASMTKILTVLVAAEHVDNLDDTFTITREITDYGYMNDCSAAGFEENEVVSVRDLFYGTILPSGADAGVGLATYVAGSQEAFVEMMNEKLEQLGISDTTHFTNCVGIYDDNHYSTPYDMAVILSSALDNELCREVLSAHTYTTSQTEQHPDGIIISNWFLRRIEDKDTGGEVICAKTGFVVQSGSCAASYGRSNSGKEYLCVTAGSTSSWRCIYDHVALYKQQFS
jgi:D-alanyl-D-alanine carboxypeptidase (penicillin-binding protein 5/6)